MSETEGDGETEGYVPDENPPETVEISLYIPEHQLEIWSEHADELGMNRSEFIRAMVQAGRRDFTVSPGPSEDAVRDDILQLLEEHGELDHSEIVQHLVDEIEADVGDAIVELQRQNDIRYARDGFVAFE